MFANCDYPGDDPAFCASVSREAEQFLSRTEARACLAVLCGNSEIEQQIAMLGLARESWKVPLFEEVLREIASALAVMTEALRRFDADRRCSAFSAQRRPHSLLRSRRLSTAAGGRSPRGRAIYAPNVSAFPTFPKTPPSSECWATGAPRFTTTTLEGSSTPRQRSGLGFPGRSRSLHEASVRRRSECRFAAKTPSAHLHSGESRRVK